MCVCVCVCVCVFVHYFGAKRITLYVYMYVCLCVCVCVCVCVYVYMYTPGIYIYMYMYIHTHIVCFEGEKKAQIFHFYLSCPRTSPLTVPLVAELGVRVPWQQYTEHQRMAVLLGTIPHGLQVKFHKAWIATIVPRPCSKNHWYGTKRHTGGRDSRRHDS